MHDVDVAIVGGGIVGASCAYHLARGGADVVVLERADAPGEGSTGRSVAGVRVQFTETTNIALSLYSIAEYERFHEVIGVDSGYRPIGYLLLVPDEQWDDHLAAVDRQRDLGALVDVLTIEDVRSRFTDLVPDGLAGATYGPRDGIIDPHAVTVGYLGGARSLGARVRLGAAVTRVERAGDDWVLGLGSGEAAVRATTIVNAAGCWSGEVAALAGLEVPVWPVRRTVFTTAPRPDREPLPLIADLATGAYLRPEGQRLIFSHSDPDEPIGFAEGVDWSALEPAVDRLAGRFPWFLDEGLDRTASWFGYYEETPDHNPVLGRRPGEPSWVDACGFSGHGVQQAPAVGRVIAEEVLCGLPELLDIDTLRLDRFDRERSDGERHVI